MDKPLAGKTALVTGAGRGIGRAICTALAREGAAIVAVARTRDQIDGVADEIRGAGGRALAVVADVTRDDEILASVETATRELGGVDILVNNAGDNILGRIDQQDPEVWWNQIVVGVRGPYQYCRAVIPGMRAKNWGRIINISSVNGQKGAFGQANYSAAKAGMHGFTKALALEYARKGVTVNTVSPGYIGTKMVLAVPKDVLDAKIIPQIPLGRLGTPDEVAALVVYMCSDEAAFMTGANVAINGGQHMA